MLMNTKETILLAQDRMLQFTHEFTDDIQTSLEIAERNAIQLNRDEIQNIIICGMGGSGIGGMLAKDILHDHITLPIEFIKGYQLPKYVSEKSLVICSSYSGNTEETLSLYHEAIDKKAQIIVICSGGQLENKCSKQNIQTLLIPGGKQPRAAVGLSLVQQLHILGHLFLNASEKKQLFNNLLEISKKLKEQAVELQKNANSIAKDLHNKNITVYTETKFASLATRFMQQINENAKKKIHVGIIPEMNHNELVAFTDFNRNDIAIFVNGKHFHPQNKKRITFLKEQLKNQESHIIEINVDGNSIDEIFLKTIYLMDLVSIELAKIKDVDPEKIDIIYKLKSSL
jgi:glucose/mannose-6-phosphate isomerase